MTDTDTKHKDEIIERPAKGWRNWGRTLEPTIDADGKLHEAGKVEHGSHVWPSKEVAEQKATEDLERSMSTYGRHFFEYLGAFPEGVRP